LGWNFKKRIKKKKNREKVGQGSSKEGSQQGKRFRKKGKNRAGSVRSQF